MEERGRWHIVLGITWGLFQLSISILYHSCDYCIKFDSRLIFLRGQNTNHSNFVQRIIHFIKRPFLLPFAASEIRIEPFLTVCIKSVFQWIKTDFAHHLGWGGLGVTLADFAHHLLFDSCPQSFGGMK